jgi:hypothetical protein
MEQAHRLLKNGHPLRFPACGQVFRRCGVPQSTPLAGSPTRRRGKKSLLIRRDATLKIS